jgi:hypothetical protein
MNAEPQSSGDRLLKVHEIAMEMRADDKTVYRRIRDGKLLAQKEGGRWVMWQSALMVYLGKPVTNGGLPHV